MSRWRRVIRGMIGMGLTFSAGVGAVAAAIAGVVSLLPGSQGGAELIQVVVASAVWAFPVGVAFSGVVALTARGRSFEKLSLPRFAATGVGAGLVLYGVLAVNAWDAWTLDAALVNAAIFVLLGGGSATAALLLARRAGSRLEAGDGPPNLPPGAGAHEEEPA